MICQSAEKISPFLRKHPNPCSPPTALVNEKPRSRYYRTTGRRKLAQSSGAFISTQPTLGVGPDCMLRAACENCDVKTYPVTFIEIGLLSGTRALAAAGLTLILAKRLPLDKQAAVGWSLFGAGSVIYLTILADVLLRNRDQDHANNRQLDLASAS